MKYETDEALEEILRRSRRIRQGREKRLVRLYSLASLFVVGILTLLISGMAGGTVPSGSQGQMGSFLLSAEAGGYILTAVAAFAAGVILTMITKKYRHRFKYDKKRKRSQL